jgi:hypothetical protein
MLIVQIFRKSQILLQAFHRCSEFEYNLNRQSTSLTNNSFSEEKYEPDYIHDDYVIADYVTLSFKPEEFRVYQISLSWPSTYES